MRATNYIATILVLLFASISFADTHTDDSTGFTIRFPDNWKIDEADAVVANAPDRLASMLVISFKNTENAADALQRLDRDDVMGNQIKSIRPDEKVLSKKINGLPAKLFTGTANLGNIKMPFVAAVVQDKGPAFVVFCFPANNAHLQRMVASIDSIRGAGSGKSK
jgi:hypothetical protein